MSPPSQTAGPWSLIAAVFELVRLPNAAGVSGGPWLTGFLRFYAICFWSLGFTLAGLWLLVAVAGLWVLVAQALLVVASPLINYQLNRMWAFRQ